MLFQSFFVSLCCVLQLSRALDLYLSPSRDLRGNEDASAVLSHHLGLEIFEPLREASQADYFASPFIGQGVNSALLVVLEDEDAEGMPSNPDSGPHSDQLGCSATPRLPETFAFPLIQLFLFFILGFRLYRKVETCLLFRFPPLDRLDI